MKTICKTIFLLTVAAVCLSDRAQADEAPRTAVIHDGQGREIIPGGFVTITEDRIGTIHYEPDDYRRMVRMGANFQVIRIALGRLGGWPGKEVDPAYLGQIDSMVQMGREAGLNTIFKMVVYGIGGSSSVESDAGSFSARGGTFRRPADAWRVGTANEVEGG